MKTKLLTLKRETKDIFTVDSNFSYWSDGAKIHSRVAFNASHILSSIRAQAIDRESGLSYLLVSPVSFTNAAVLSTAGGLQIGESETVAVA